MERTQLVAVTVALASLLLAPVSQAGWTAPEEGSYEGQQRLIVETPAWRSEFAAGSDTIAWTEQGWDEEENARDEDADPTVAYVRYPDDEANRTEVGYPSGGIANAPALGDGYMAWRSFPGHSSGSPDLGDDAALKVMDLDTRKAMTVSPTMDRTGEPHLEGTVLTWSTWELGSSRAEIHRLDLATDERHSWQTPVNCEVSDLATVNESLLLWCDDVFSWRPGTDEVTKLVDGAVTLDAEDPWAIATEYRPDDESRGVELYLYDVENGTDRRLTFGEGRSHRASIDGPLVAWADTREAHRSGGGPGPIDVYFQDLRVGNEYKVENTTGTTSLVLVDETVYANDEAGRLVAIDLPREDERLTARVEGHVQEAGNGTRRLNVTVNATSPDPGTSTSLAWDTDRDGDFEQEGELTVTLEPNATPNQTLQGILVEEERHAVVNVDVGQVYHSAIAQNRTDPSAEGTDGSRSSNGTDVNSSREGAAAPSEENATTSPLEEDDNLGPGEDESKQRSRDVDRLRQDGEPVPGPGAAIVLAVTLLAHAGARRRGDRRG